VRRLRNAVIAHPALYRAADRVLKAGSRARDLTHRAVRPILGEVR
jgi:hypothetical protein